jgi:hypothetical protein
VAQVTKQRRIWKCGEKIKKKKRASQPEDFWFSTALTMFTMFSLQILWR